ncbi:unnamed protein product [Vitrella brassicaformis CCMP3155]|uniref:Uncharacterized protein n=4 Tax=Vitrella brassicaformis TaxID=1169539 RepID=A0A0G4FUQ0_VITBC|nr:unnamed protein product [Vitrella brassicaformis CCMP3155]|eukprot:CEM18680.1 unnamed protein product [Vitrella brassicaformis CCMP3155]
MDAAKVTPTTLPLTSTAAAQHPIMHVVPGPKDDQQDPSPSATGGSATSPNAAHHANPEPFAALRAFTQQVDADRQQQQQQQQQQQRGAYATTLSPVTTYPLHPMSAQPSIISRGPSPSRLVARGAGGARSPGKVSLVASGKPPAGGLHEGNVKLVQPAVPPAGQKSVVDLQGGKSNKMTALSVELPKGQSKGSDGSGSAAANAGQTQGTSQPVYHGMYRAPSGPCFPFAQSYPGNGPGVGPDGSTTASPFYRYPSMPPTFTAKYPIGGSHPPVSMQRASTDPAAPDGKPKTPSCFPMATATYSPFAPISHDPFAVFYAQHPHTANMYTHLNGGPTPAAQTAPPAPPPAQGKKGGKGKGDGVAVVGQRRSPRVAGRGGAEVATTGSKGKRDKKHEKGREGRRAKKEEAGSGGQEQQHQQQQQQQPQQRQLNTIPLTLPTLPTALPGSGLSLTTAAQRILMGTGSHSDTSGSSPEPRHRLLFAMPHSQELPASPSMHPIPLPQLRASLRSPSPPKRKTTTTAPKHHPKRKAKAKAEASAKRGRRRQGSMSRVLWRGSGGRFTHKPDGDDDWQAEDDEQESGARGWIQVVVADAPAQQTTAEAGGGDQPAAAAEEQKNEGEAAAAAAAVVKKEPGVAAMGVAGGVRGVGGSTMIDTIRSRRRQNPARYRDDGQDEDGNNDDDPFASSRGAGRRKRAAKIRATKQQQQHEHLARGLYEEAYASLEGYVVGYSAEEGMEGLPEDHPALAVQPPQKRPKGRGGRRKKDPGQEAFSPDDPFFAAGAAAAAAAGYADEPYDETAGMEQMDYGEEGLECPGYTDPFAGYEQHHQQQQQQPPLLPSVGRGGGRRGKRRLKRSAAERDMDDFLFGDDMNEGMEGGDDDEEGGDFFHHGGDIQWDASGGQLPPRRRFKPRALSEFLTGDLLPFLSKHDKADRKPHRSSRRKRRRRHGGGSSPDNSHLFHGTALPVLPSDFGTLAMPKKEDAEQEAFSPDDVAGGEDQEAMFGAAADDGAGAGDGDGDVGMEGEGEGEGEGEDDNEGVDESWDEGEGDHEGGELLEEESPDGADGEMEGMGMEEQEEDQPMEEEDEEDEDEEGEEQLYDHEQDHEQQEEQEA